MANQSMSQSLALCLFSLILCVSSPQASAQPSNSPAPKASQESAAYRKAIREGVEEFDRGNYPEARSAFTRAHELSPSARTYRALGLVAFELRNYGETVELLEAALASREKPLDDAQRKSTEELLARARRLIARVHLDVSPSPSKVLVDGVPVELSEGQVLVLQVGDHVIEVFASGYMPERRAVRVSGGEELKLAVQMRAPESSAVNGSAGLDQEQQPAPSEPKRDERKRWRRNPWLWTAVGLVAVGAGVGIAYALRPEPETRPAPPTGTDHTPPGGVLRPLRSW